MRAEIERLAVRLAEVKVQESGLQSELSRLNLELELQQAELQEATTAHELAASQADTASARILELETALRTLEQNLAHQLGGLYRLGRRGYLRLFLALEPDRSLLPALRQLRFLVRRDHLLIHRYTETHDQLLAQRGQLEVRRREMVTWKTQEAARRDRLVRLQRKQKQLVAQAANEHQQLAARSDQLQDKERKLRALIASLLAGSLTPLSGSAAQKPIQDFRGALDWPLRGRVLGRFGPRLDPRYRTEVPHNGLDIAPEESEVRAVFPGEVLYAASFEGYGLMVVVHHPDRVFTLYAGLRELKVVKGDVLSLGQALGRVGENLYFEIRHENQPQDPLTWLR